MRLDVVKADGSVEAYLHTKVLCTISNALGLAGQADTEIAEELAEVVTYFLYKRDGTGRLASSEIFSMVKVVLEAIGHEQAAIALTEYHHQRRMKRDRVEVVLMDVNKLSDAQLCSRAEACMRSRWDKTRIVDGLTARYGLGRHTARMIASMVEEKVLGMGASSVPSSLVKQLVLGETAAVLRARQQLQPV